MTAAPGKATITARRRSTGTNDASIRIQGANREHEPWRNAPEPGREVASVILLTCGDSADLRILREFLNRVSIPRAVPNVGRPKTPNQLPGLRSGVIH
jgi:hypothetical protein